MARKGSIYGVPAPLLVQMEQDIDAEIEMDDDSSDESSSGDVVVEEVVAAPPPPRRRPQRKKQVDCDFKSLDEMVGEWNDGVSVTVIFTFLIRG